MDFFENLLPVIIVIVYIFSLFLKKKTEGNKTGEVKKKSGLGKAIEDIMSQVKQEIEKAKIAQEIMVKPELQNQPVKLEPEPSSISVKKLDTKDKKQTLPNKGSKTTSGNDIEKKISLPESREKGIGRMDLNISTPQLSVTDLQQAIIWKEILGPPLGLREDL